MKTLLHRGEQPLVASIASTTANYGPNGIYGSRCLSLHLQKRAIFE